MALSDRLHDLIVRGLRLNITTFSQEIGFNHPATISRIVNGKSLKPGVDIFQNIKRVYPSVNIEWLITGDGRMFVDEEENHNREGSSDMTEIISINRELLDKIDKHFKVHNEYMRILSTAVDP